MNNFAQSRTWIFNELAAKADQTTAVPGSRIASLLPILGFVVKCLFPPQTLKPENQTRTGQIKAGYMGGGLNIIQSNSRFPNPAPEKNRCHHQPVAQSLVIGFWNLIGSWLLEVGAYWSPHAIRTSADSG